MINIITIIEMQITIVVKNKHASMKIKII